MMNDDSFDAHRVWREAIDLCREEEGFTEMRFDVMVGTRQVVHTDHVKIRSILGELIGNAIRHRKTGTLCLCGMAVFRDGDFLEFTVSDNGTGMDKNLEEKITAFLISEDNLHSGLGRAKKLAGELEGKIVLVRTSNRGTVFRIKVRHFPLTIG